MWKGMAKQRHVDSTHLFRLTLPVAPCAPQLVFGNRDRRIGLCGRSAVEGPEPKLGSRALERETRMTGALSACRVVCLSHAPKPKPADRNTPHRRGERPHRNNLSSVPQGPRNAWGPKVGNIALKIGRRPNKGFHREPTEAVVRSGARDLIRAMFRPIVSAIGVRRRLARFPNLRRTDDLAPAMAQLEESSVAVFVVVSLSLSLLFSLSLSLSLGGADGRASRGFGSVGER